MAVTVHSNILLSQFPLESSKKLSRPKDLPCTPKLPDVTHTSDGVFGYSFSQRKNSAPGISIVQKVSRSPGRPTTCRRHCRIANSAVDETRRRLDQSWSVPPFRLVKSDPWRDPVEWARIIIQSSFHQIAPALVGLGSALAISLCGASLAWAEDDQLTITFPTSGDDRVRTLPSMPAAHLHACTYGIGDSPAGSKLPTCRSASVFAELM